MNRFVSLSIVVLTTVFASCDEFENPLLPQEEIVAVANRASGSVSFIDAKTDKVVETLSIEESEPMYVVYVPVTDKVYVGDRAQNQVHVIDPDSREVETSITVGEGVFHMWADGRGNQLWVNNDIDNTVSVIDLSSNAVVQTIDVGVKPHDVFLTRAGSMAYVSVFAEDASVADSVFAYSTTTYEKLASQAVGKDPHLYHIFSNNRLYVPNQSGELFVLDGSDLSEISSVPLEGAHGIFPSPKNDFLFITNLPGSQLYSVRTEDTMLNGDPLDSPLPIPHNVTVNRSGSKTYVTHSGATANQVTVYTSRRGNLALIKTLIVGNNPFGLAYYKRVAN